MPTTWLCSKASFERRGWLVGWLFIINSRGLARLLFIYVCMILHAWGGYLCLDYVQRIIKFCTIVKSRIIKHIHLYKRNSKIFIIKYWAIVKKLFDSFIHFGENMEYSWNPFTWTRELVSIEWKVITVERNYVEYE